MPAQPGTPASQMPASDDAIIRRIQELERQVREIVPSVAASFGPVITELQDAQATLAAQVATIAALVDAQIFTDAKNASAVSATATTTFQGFATVTFTVPAGYTSAAVIATSSSGFGTAAVQAQMYTQIAGEDGEVMNVYPDSGSVGNGSSGHARVFAVTPGSTYTVTTAFRVSSGTGTIVITTSALATYRR